MGTTSRDLDLFCILLPRAHLTFTADSYVRVMYVWYCNIPILHLRAKGFTTTIRFILLTTDVLLYCCINYLMEIKVNLDIV